jgi:MFS family permease
MFRMPRLTAWLERAPPTAFAIFTIGAAFSAYFSMYAFRKPFGAGTFEGTVPLPWGGEIGYKSLFVISQLIGYAGSKFLGIKVISELGPDRRAQGILGCISIAWSALLMFALVPAPYNAIFMIINGIPLGMIWGFVFGYLEGRKLTEVLGAGLSASYIVASGAVKTIGGRLLDAGVPEYWMPFATGALFALPMLLCVWLLSHLPPPSAEDEAARTKREPMDGEARIGFLRTYGPGLLSLTALYVFLTAYRDFRDNFAVEIWREAGSENVTELLATSETQVTVGVLAALALLMVVKDNRFALALVHAMMLLGTALIGVSTAMFQSGSITPETWMVLTGLGLYVAYVPFGCILFDRLIAATGAIGTAGFMIYVTDASGYAGSVVLTLYRELGQPDLSWLDFFVTISYATSAICTVMFTVSAIYFWRVTGPKAVASAT